MYWQTNTARLGETSAARVQTNFALNTLFFCCILEDRRFCTTIECSILIRVNGNRFKCRFFRESIDKRNSDTGARTGITCILHTHRTSAFCTIFASVWRPIGESRKSRRSTLVHDKALRPPPPHIFDSVSRQSHPRNCCAYCRGPLPPPPPPQNNRSVYLCIVAYSRNIAQRLVSEHYFIVLIFLRTNHQNN